MRPAPLSRSRLVPAASNVDLPEPGTPVTSVRPLQRSQTSAISGSTPSSSKPGGLSGSTRMAMSMPKRCCASTGERLQRKRRNSLGPDATAYEQSMALPERRMPSAVLPPKGVPPPEGVLPPDGVPPSEGMLPSEGMPSKIRAQSLPITTPSRRARVARCSTPSISTKAGEPVWKAMSEAPRSAAQSRKQSSPAAGKA